MLFDWCDCFNGISLTVDWMLWGSILRSSFFGPYGNREKHQPFWTATSTSEITKVSTVCKVVYVCICTNELCMHSWGKSLHDFGKHCRSSAAEPEGRTLLAKQCLAETCRLCPWPQLFGHGSVEPLYLNQNVKSLSSQTCQNDLWKSSRIEHNHIISHNPTLQLPSLTWPLKSSPGWQPWSRLMPETQIRKRKRYIIMQVKMMMMINDDDDDQWWWWGWWWWWPMMMMMINDDDDDQWWWWW